MAKKKITRGVSKDFAKAFKESELYDLYENNRDELIVGVRNNYLNLYYNCDSVAKIKYTKGSIWCEIDKYYIDGNHYSGKDQEKRFKTSPKLICDHYNKIKEHSDIKPTDEKKAQSKLVILNNLNKNSNWHCVDVEYVKSFHNQTEKREAGLNARFDIIAVSKEKPHRVALIELKYGSGAIGSPSGIYKHVKDFVKFCDKDKGFFDEHLKDEIVEIIKSQKELGLSVPYELNDDVKLLPPEFYFVTLNNNAKNNDSSTPKQTMAGYLFNDYRWGCKRLSKVDCVEAEFGDITKKDNRFNATFLFSSATLENIEITDIIDGDYDEKIFPE